MYNIDIVTLKLFIFVLVVNRTIDKCSNQEVKAKWQNKIEVLIYGPISCTTLPFSKEFMKNVYVTTLDKLFFYNTTEIN